MSVAATAIASSVLAVAPSAASAALAPVPVHSVQTRLVQRYLTDLRTEAYDDAYRLLNSAARAYYRNAQNLRSVYAADGYHIERFTLIGLRSTQRDGSVYFARETARFRDHAHDLDLRVSATVPVGVVNDRGAWRIKDPGHPWRAFMTHASATLSGLQVTVKKVSFFIRRIETIVTFANHGSAFVTLLPYGKSVLRDAAGTPYRIIETRNWALTDKTLFEGLRLAPNAQYTGTLAFECAPLDNTQRTFALSVAPVLVDGADLPFSIEIDDIAATRPPQPAR